MRPFLLAATVILAGTPAMASSIEMINDPSPAGASMVIRACRNCPDVKKMPKASSYAVPVLENGVPRTELVTIDGKEKLLRTDAMLGGSPVVHVVKAPIWFPEKEKVTAAATLSDMPAPHDEAATSNTADGIDTLATTSALDVASQPVTAGMASSASAVPRTLESDAFRLRLN